MPYRRHPNPKSEKTDWAPAWLRHAAWRARPALKYAIVVMVISLVTALSGCGNAALQIQVQAANGVATAANAGLPILIERYDQEGIDAIMAVKKVGGTKDDSRAAAATVKAKWDPVWRAWETLKVAQDAWAGALESGGDTSAALGQLKGAYCGLKEVWPKEIPAVPLGPMKCPDPAPVQPAPSAVAPAPAPSAPVAP